MINNVTAIRDARAMRAAGWPLNTEVIEGGPLPKPCEDGMKAGFKAAIKFRDRVYDLVKNQNASTMAAARRAFNRFMKATEPPTGDAFEEQITAAILRSEFQEIREQWAPIFERLNAGEEVTLDLSRLWPFESTEATKRRLQNPEPARR